MVTNSKTILLAASLLFLSSCEDGGVSGLGEAGGGCDPCKIFITASGSNGNLGGVSGADARCASDANNPGGGTYKAFVGLAGTRVGTAGAQIDWVIKPNTEYTRVDGTLIANSDTNGNLPAVLTNAISGVAVAGGGIMTGLSDSGVPQGADCAGWTSGLVGQAITIGVANEPGSGWANNGNSTCNLTTRKIYCIQQ